MIRIATWPIRTVYGLALDVIFGKDECKDYVSPTVRQAMDS